MTTPHLSSPILVYPADLKENSELTSQIITLINDAFRRSKLPDPQKWDFERPRFPTPESYYEMLVPETVVALILDLKATRRDLERESDRSGKVVACAAAVPWKGGWAKEGAAQEDGWEIKAVAVDGYDQYLHKGLAVQVMTALERHLVEKAKRQSQTALSSTYIDPKPSEERGRLTLWILAAECINGAYWKKRGYREVRRSMEGKGTWGCKTSFDLVVFRKDVEYIA
jgi:hypothetical protein